MDYWRLRGGPEVPLEIPEPVPAAIVGELVFGDSLPPMWSHGGLALKYLSEFWAPFMTEAQELIGAHFPSSDSRGHTQLEQAYLSNLGGDNPSQSIRFAFRKLAKRLGVNSYSILLPDNQSDLALNQSNACLALTHVPLVDLTNANWDQVMEFRADPDSRRKLRRLRLLFLAEYEGKPRSFIEDDVQRRLDDYQYAAKKCGFELVNGSLSALLDTNSLQAAAVAGIAGGIFGGPLAGLVAGAAVEVGRVAIAISEKLVPIRELADGHELAYVVKARKQLE